MTEQATKETGYQGWANYNTWAVAFILGNDRGTYEQCREFAEGAKGGAADADQVADGTWTIAEAARFNLADMLKEYVEELVEISDAAEKAINGDGKSTDMIASDTFWRDV